MYIQYYKKNLSRHITGPFDLNFGSTVKCHLTTKPKLKPRRYYVQFS